MKNIPKVMDRMSPLQPKRNAGFQLKHKVEEMLAFLKKSTFVPSILETLLENSPSSHKGYPCDAAKVSAWVGDLPSKCQLCNICCSRHGSRFYFHTRLLNWHSLPLLCQCCFSFPFCALSFHCNALFPHM